MHRLRAGVIGPGIFGGHHAHKYQADPRVELVGVFGIEMNSARMLAHDVGAEPYETIDELLEEVDIVTVSSPPATHASAASLALERGKHVLIEKPISARIDEAQMLLALAKRKDLIIACGHQERLVFEAMGLFDAPERPRRIESVREGPWTGRSADVSVTLDLMIHDLDLAARLMGIEPKTILAEGQAKHGRSADRVHAKLIYQDGRTMVCSASRIADARTRTMKLTYDEGEVNVDFVARTFENTTPHKLNPDFASTNKGADPLGANVTCFVDAVSGESPRPAVTGEEGLEALELAHAIDAAMGLPSLS